MPEWLNVIVRSLVAIVFLFVITKLIGKRQLSQMTFFEYTVGIVIGDIAGFIAIDMRGRILYGMLSMIVFAAFTIVLGQLAMKSKAVRNIVEGKARILIKDGKILEDNMKKERLSADELLEQLRLKNAFRVADVEFALMEPNGEVSVLMKSANRSLTPKTLGMEVSPETEPQAVIMDGSIMDEALSTIGMNRNWLHTELNKQGVALENVFLGQVDAKGTLYFDLYDDKINVPQQQVPKLTHITLKKCQADLELFALSTNNQDMKQTYENEAKRLQQVIDDITPLLIR